MNPDLIPKSNPFPFYHFSLQGLGGCLLPKKIFYSYKPCTRVRPLTLDLVTTSNKRLNQTVIHSSPLGVILGSSSRGQTAILQMGLEPAPLCLARRLLPLSLCKSNLYTDFRHFQTLFSSWHECAEAFSSVCLPCTKATVIRLVPLSASLLFLFWSFYLRDLCIVVWPQRSCHYWLVLSLSFPIPLLFTCLITPCSRMGTASPKCLHYFIHIFPLFHYAVLKSEYTPSISSWMPWERALSSVWQLVKNFWSTVRAYIWYLNEWGNEWIRWPWNAEIFVKCCWICIKLFTIWRQTWGMWQLLDYPRRDN